MPAVPRERMTESRYLELERESAEKHEYVNGERYAMAGGTPLHAAIAANVVAALKAALRGTGCGVASSDLRVHVPSTRFYTYPDVTVVCGRIETLPGDESVVTNPTLLVEVLSPHTEAHDRGAKFSHYERLASLAEYLLVSADGTRLEHFRRVEHGQWLRTVVDARDAQDGVLELPTLQITLSLRDVADGLEIFMPADPQA
jgi:Uma2 family endonuclease